MNKIIKLPFISMLESNLARGNSFIQVILGPRQVGKTTSILDFIDGEYPNKYHYVSADETFNSSASWIMEQWQIASKKSLLLVIDEIQKCENWAEVIKMLWDASQRKETKERPISCILLGSSSLQIQKGLTESLTGRFQLIKAFHWNLAESKEGYGLDLEEYLQFGGYPGSYQFTELRSQWVNYIKNSIITTVLDKDILLYHTVKSPSLFRQAFELVISYPAQEISYTKLLGQLQEKGNVELVKYYLSLLEGAYLIKCLSKYTGKPVLTRASSPKILPLAPCLFQLTIIDEYDGKERGRAFELMVGAQLARVEADLYYWREKNDEVDFILKQGKNIWAIEVKSGRKKSEKGLMKFMQKFPKSKGVILTPENYSDFEQNPIGFLSSSSLSGPSQ
mgnify:CR=1 FL=1